MKYKLLKDYPQLKAGCIGYPADKANYDYYIFEQDGKRIHIDRDLVGLTDEWFEPVIERWRAGIKESRYFVTSDGGLNSGIECHDEIDDAYFESGNYFKTREQAEEASRRIKKVLMDYHKELANEH